MNKKKNIERYQPNFIIGLDALSLGRGFFSDQKTYQMYISSTVKNQLNAIVEGGYAQNKYQKNGYDADAFGIFAKIGGFYMLVTDKENKKNGFYGGGKLGGSYYSQEYKSIPIRGVGGNSGTIKLPKSQQSSYWLEATVGARVQLLQTPLYLDLNIQPRYLVYTTKQDQVQPMIVPGFGNSSSKFNLGVSWSIAYEIK